MRIELASRVLCAWLAVSALACTDPMVVGDQPACELECPNGLHCDVDVQRCVQCKIDDDCAGRSNTPYCEGFGCVQCRAIEDCTNGRMCAAGACVQCVEDRDCNNGSEPFEVHLCQFGSCVDSH